MLLLLIVISCLQFAISQGFHFDRFEETVLTAGDTITLFWHRDVNDTSQISFYRNIPDEENHIATQIFLFSTAGSIQPNGTLNVTFPESRDYNVYATNDDYGLVVATTQTFSVVPHSTDGGSDNSTAPPFAVSSATVSPLASSVSEHGKPSSSSNQPISNSTPLPHRNRKTSIIIGAVIGSLVSLLLLFGGGAFLFIRKRRYQNLKHRLSPNPKIIPELNSHSPPVGNKNSETITHTLAGGVAKNVGCGSQDPVEESSEGNPTEEGKERRNSIGTPVHVDTSEPQGAPQQEGPQAALDVVAEVLRLRTQFQQFIVEREAERVQGNALDPPPAYA